MTDADAFHDTLDEAAFEDLWFKLRGIVRMREIGDRPEARLPDILESHLLIAVNRDDAQFTIDSRLYSLKRGAVFIGVPGQRIAYMGNVSPEAEDGGYLLFFDMRGKSALQEAAVRRIGNERAGGVIPEAFASILLHLCATAHLHWRHDSKWERFRSQAAFQEIVYHVLRQTDAAVNPGLDAALEQTRLYLDRHYHENPSMEQLAQQVGVSSRHFRRAFKQRFGISATDYVTDFRMSQAKRLMATTKQPLAEIARQVGYQDESHFRRTFKNHLGLSPAMYVKNRRLKIAACSFPNIGQLLPLGIIPFAAPIDHEWTDAYRRKYHTEVLFPLHHNNENNRRTLTAAKPDRILAIDVFGSAEFQQGLNEIAPVLVIPWRTKTWREHLLMTAAFLHKAEEAEEWLAAYDEKADRACGQWSRLARKERATVLMVDRHHCYRWKGSGGNPIDSNDLPFAPMRHKPGGLDHAFERVVPEKLSACDADRILLLLSEDRHSQLTWHTLRRSESWNRLKAVRSARVRFITLGPWFEYTAYNHGIIMDQALKALE